MRDYGEFVTRLRREIEEADLGRPEPRLEGLEALPRRALSQPVRLAAAAALLVALGVGAYAGYGAYDGRRVLSEDNRQFVDALFDRGLFEIGTVSSPNLDALFEWTATSWPEDAPHEGDTTAGGN